MKTANELIDELAAQNQIPCAFLNMELAREWVRFFACDDMSSQVREDCLMEPLDYFRYGN